MRDITIEQAGDEIELLDKVSVDLAAAIRDGYDDIRAHNPARWPLAGDNIEIAARLHNNRRNLIEALEEVGRRGYGRVVVAREEDEDGHMLRPQVVYRVSQANANLPQASIISRNSKLGGEIASCQVGDDLEVHFPKGDRYLVVTALIDIEGAVQLLRPRPDIKLARFYIADDSGVDIVRDVRAFVEGQAWQARAEEVVPEIAEREKKTRPENRFKLYWPIEWSKVILADEPEASLGAQFFTRTTKQQEAAIQAVRGVTVVNGIAGTGKTSVALGRLKFFANFRSGENTADYGLDPNDWADFDSSNMIGFVLSPSLVQYLKQTADDLEMRIKIQDFEEYRDQERQSRRLFGRNFKRSPDGNPELQRTVRWLRALDDIASLDVAAAIEAIQQEPLVKPETADSTRVSDARWRELEKQFWKAGPLRARLIGLVRGLRSPAGDRSGPLRLQGIAAALDRDARVSDQETAALSTIERRVLREAVLNATLRLLRVLNPSDIYVAAHKSEALNAVLATHFPEQVEAAIGAAGQAVTRLDQRLITDDDVVTALCLNALMCDQFERDMRDIPYLATFSDRVGVFIDEYQDFSEQQVFLMGFRAKRKYRQITVSGDVSQRLHVGGIAAIANAFPYVGESARQISLETNHRQSKDLAELSNRFRAFTDGGGPLDGTACGAPLYTYQNREKFAEFIASKIGELPGAASVVVLSSTEEVVQEWFELMFESLESRFRNPIVSDRARLIERFKTHFTTPLQAKGLEFDVAVVPNIAEFGETDLIALNGLYVGVSRPRHALLLGCEAGRAGHSIVKQLCHRGDLVAVSPRADT